MANSDPIENAITLLGVLATPTGDGTGSASTTLIYNNIQIFTKNIFSISADTIAVCNDINTALTDASNVLGKISTSIGSAGSLTDVSSAMTALQNTLSLLQTMAPAGTAVVFNSAGGLFQAIQSQLTALSSAGVTDIAVAAKELAQLAQLLTSLAGLFPTGG